MHTGIKAAADVYSPVSGEVIAVNYALEDTPETINEDPYDAGWIVRIKVSNLTEIGTLMDAAAYAAYCESRE